MEALIAFCTHCSTMESVPLLLQITSWATSRPAPAAAAAASETGPAAPQTAGARRHFQLPPLPHNPVLDNPVQDNPVPPPFLVIHPPPPLLSIGFSADDIFNFLCHCPALPAPPLINSSNFSYTNYSSMSSEISMRDGENRACQGSLNSKWFLNSGVAKGILFLST